MLNQLQILCYIFLVTLLVGCSSSPNLVEEAKVEVEVPEELFVKEKEEYPDFMQAIVGNDSVSFRGILPGMTMSEVRGVETATHEETDSLIVRFMIEEGLRQNAELEYYFNGDSIFDHLEMTIYNASESLRDSLFIDLFNYSYYYHGVREFDDVHFTHETENLFVTYKKEGTAEFPNLFIQVAPLSE